MDSLLRRNDEKFSYPTETQRPLNALLKGKNADMKKIFILILLAALALTACVKKPAGQTNKVYTERSMKLVDIQSKQASVLRQTSQTVQFPLDEKTKSLITEMKTLFSTIQGPYGAPVGLAAPQIGVPLRIILIQIPPEAKTRRKDVYETFPLTVWINPSYTPVREEGKYTDWEGCLSIDGKMGEVERFKVVHYEAYDESGQKISGTARGLFARIIQHEVDHLNGRLYIDRLQPKDRCGPLDQMMKIRNQEMKALSAVNEKTIA
jgi:peptide deformylase